jgi:hypothetical protein
MRRREISPGFWKDERIWKLSHEAKLLYLGMTQVADREGRLLDKPFEIGVEVWPWAPAEAGKLIEEMVAVGLVARYRVGETACLAYPSAAWKRHQRPHPKEQPSRIPRNPLESEAAEGAPQGAPRSSPGITQVLPSREKVLPSREKVVPSRAGSSGSSEPSGSLRTSQDHRDLSGPSEQSPVQARFDGGEDPTGRKISHWVKLWEEKLSVARLMRIAANEYTTVEDPLFDVEEHDLDLKPQTINAVLKKVSEDLAKKFSSPEKPWTLAERLEAVEQAWEAYLTSHFGAGVDPPYALNAFASPKTSIPSYERAKAEA